MRDDPLTRGGGTCSDPSGSPLFEISCRDSLSAPQESHFMACLVWFSSFSYYLSVFPIHLFKKYFVAASRNQVLAMLETSGEPGRAPASLEHVATPPLLSSSVIGAITRGHRLRRFQHTEQDPVNQGGMGPMWPESPRGDLWRDFRGWSSLHEPCLGPFVASPGHLLTLIFFVRPGSLTLSSKHTYIIPAPAEEPLPCSVDQGSYKERGSQPCKTWRLI